MLALPAVQGRNHEGEIMDERAIVRTTRVAYQGRIFDVAVERVVLPHEPPREADLEIVRHAPSVVLVPMADDGRVLLVRQYRHPAGEWLWELPAGSVDAGETPEGAARRECQEELGLMAGSLQPLGTLFALPGYCTEEMTFFRVTALRQPGPGDPAAHQDEDEFAEPGAFTFDRLQRMTEDGEIKDLKTVAGLALARRR
jgi:ADP-ribose pyrophosphatase